MNNLSIRLNTPQKPLKPAFSDQSKLKKIFFVTKSVTKKKSRHKLFFPSGPQLPKDKYTM